MLHFSRWKIFSLLGVVLFGFYLLSPNFFSDDNLTKAPSFIPKSKLQLGLDLQGGSYLLLQVETNAVISETMNILREDVRFLLRDKGESGRIVFRNLHLTKSDTVRVTIIKPEQRDKASKRLNKFVKNGSLLPTGLTSQDYEFVMDDNGHVEISMLPLYKKRVLLQAVKDSIEVIRRRIDPNGTKEPSIQQQGNNRIVVQVAGDSDPDELKSLINKTGKLTFQAVDNIVTASDLSLGIVPIGKSVYPLRGGGVLAVNDTPLITGDMVENATAGISSEGGYEIRLKFDKRGARRFGDYSRDNVGKRFAIVLDEEIIVAPVIIAAVLSGDPRITGQFTASEAGNLSVLIRSGALPAPLITLEQRSVGPDLGEDSVRAGTLALIISLIAVIVFMIMSYGRFGLYADISLIANLILLFGFLSFFEATLTLPGIAGIVLTVGMAVDANVLIFERIKEELKANKRPIEAAEMGFRKALSAIMDANITTIIAAVIMLQLGAGPVRGFAVTLALGVITSVFCSFFITRLLVGLELLKTRPKKLIL